MNLKREDILMDGEGYKLYYAPAAAKILGVREDDVHRSHEAHRSFDAMLGFPLCEDYASRVANEDRPLPDDWCEFLTKLAGPYGKAFLKAYQVKYKVNSVKNGRKGCPNKVQRTHCKRGHLYRTARYTRPNGRTECKLCRSHTNKLKYRSNQLLKRGIE